MKIIVDTREQNPFLDGIRFKLNVGDYSTIYLRDKFCIERKSLTDLYSTLIQGHVRFRKELIRASVNEIELVMVVEGTKQQFINKQFTGGAKRLIASDTLNKIVETVEVRYKLKIHWCNTREVAARLTKKLLLKKELECRTKIS